MLQYEDHPKPISVTQAIVLAQLPSRWSVAAIVTAVYSFWLAGMPYRMPSSFYVLCGLGWIGVCLKSLTTLISATRGINSRVNINNVRIRWFRSTIFAPATLVLIFLLWITGTSARLVFLVSRPFLRNAAKAVESGKYIGTPRFVGLYPVTRIVTSNGQVRFIIEPGGFFDHEGLVFSQDGQPDYEDGTVQSLDKNWYLLKDYDW